MNSLVAPPTITMDVLLLYLNQIISILAHEQGYASDASSQGTLLKIAGIKKDDKETR